MEYLLNRICPLSVGYEGIKIRFHQPPGRAGSDTRRYAVAGGI